MYEPPGENMKTSESPDQSEHSTPAQAPEEQKPSVKCPECEKEITLSFKTMGQIRFSIVLSKRDEETQSSSSSAASTSSLQAPGGQICPVVCLYCQIELDPVIKGTDQNEIWIDLTVKRNIAREQRISTGNSIISNLRPYTVKVHRVVTGVTFGAADVIMKKVINNTWPSPRVTESSLDDCDIIIVFCPIVSRVGSDVDAAMKHSEVSTTEKPVVLVLMHHTRDPDYSTEGTRWSEVYKNVIHDLHVLFHETQPGLLRCKHNIHMISRLQEELYKYSKYRFTY